MHPFVCVHRSDLHEPVHESSGGNTFGKTGSSRRSLYNSILRSPFFLLRFNAPRFCPRGRARHPRIRFVKSNRSNDNYAVDEKLSRLLIRRSSFFFLFLFFFAPSSIRSERDAKFNLIRRTISLHSLSSVNSRFDRIIGGGERRGNEMETKSGKVCFDSKFLIRAAARLARPSLSPTWPNKRAGFFYGCKRKPWDLFLDGRRYPPLTRSSQLIPKPSSRWSIDNRDSRHAG